MMEAVLLVAGVYGLARFGIGKVFFTDEFSAFCRSVYDVELRAFALPERQKAAHFMASVATLLAMAAAVVINALVQMLVFGYNDASALKHFLIVAHLLSTRDNFFGLLYVAEIAFCGDITTVLACAVIGMRGARKMLDQAVALHKTVVVGDTWLLFYMFKGRVAVERVGREHPAIRTLLLSFLMLWFIARTGLSGRTDVATVAWFAYHISAVPECRNIVL
jgi:hypothetical protein